MRVIVVNDNAVVYNYEKLAEVLEKAMLTALEQMTLDEIKQLDCFNSSSYQRVGQMDVEKC